MWLPQNHLANILYTVSICHTSHTKFRNAGTAAYLIWELVIFIIVHAIVIRKLIMWYAGTAKT